MKTFLNNWIERISSSYWFLPSSMATLAIGLSFLTLHFDYSVDASWAQKAGLVWAGGAVGARNVLATIAGSTITVAGVVFSITIVALALASSQFGPSLLRNFMKDRPTQVVLGVFVATFLYCILILASIRGTDAVTFVPYLSTTVSIVLAIASVSVLIYFIHHIPTSIIAENLIGKIGTSLEHDICKRFPTKRVQKRRETSEDLLRNHPEAFTRNAQAILSTQSGYIQAIDLDALLEIAQKADAVIRSIRRPGEFVAQGESLGLFYAPTKLDEPGCKALNEAYYLGWYRTATQDIEYSLDQLVEMAVRALSPGINDPFTAMTCLEWLGMAVLQIGSRELPSAAHFDQNQKLRLIVKESDFEGIVTASFSQIRQYGCASVAVTIKLLDVIENLLENLTFEDDRKVLLAQAEAASCAGLHHATATIDKADIESRMTKIRQNPLIAAAKV